MGVSDGSLRDLAASQAQELLRNLNTREGDLGATIRQLRTRGPTALTQPPLAHLVGVDQETLHDWEQGRSRPDEAQLGALGTALGVSRARLLAPYSPN
jgi:DNA-binding transcriptional regulator YiaG